LSGKADEKAVVSLGGVQFVLCELFLAQRVGIGVSSMALAAPVEKAIQSALTSGQFAHQVDFEDVCNRVLRRVKPDFQSLRSSKNDPNKPARALRPDAYAFLEGSDRYIYFEYTERADKSKLQEDITGIPHRGYYHPIKNNLAEVVVISSQSLRPDEKHLFREILSGGLGANSSVYDVSDLVTWFSELAPDLVEPLLGIPCRPKWFRPLNEATEDLAARFIGFPDVASFKTGNLITEGLLQLIVNHFQAKRGPFLLSGRWGTGKTVAALSVGWTLHEHNGFTTYYLDLNDRLETDDRKGLALIRESLPKFRHSEVLFIVDNAHQMPVLSYGITRWAKENSANVLLVSRPVAEDMCDENQYFPKLLEAVPSARDQLEAGLEADPEDAELPSRIQSIVEVRSNLENIKSLVANHVRNNGLAQMPSEEELIEFGELIDHNLTLLVVLLRGWDPTRESITALRLAGIFAILQKKFALDEFPEVYSLAALNHIDCPADLDVLFPEATRKTAFVADTRLSGILRTRRNHVFGINAAEAKLIIQAGLHNNVPILRAPNGRVFATVEEAQTTLLVQYASATPANPYGLLRSLRWAAYEARQFDRGTEDNVREMLYAVLTCTPFASYLREVILPTRLSMVALGNVARLCSYAALEPLHSSQIITTEALEAGVQNRRTAWTERHPELEAFFTWRDFFAWRHLENLDARLATHFLSQFPYTALQSYGKHSISGLSNLLQMAAHTNWLKPLVLRDLADIVGDVAMFQQRLSKLAEIGICFLIRNAALISKEDYISELAPPEIMASIVKGRPNLNGRIFTFISRFMGPIYSRQFLGFFSLDQVYRSTFGRPLGKITSFVSEELFRRFVTTELQSRLILSEFKDIQLFLRNLCLFGFRRQQITIVAELLRKEEVAQEIAPKMKQRQTLIEEIAFFFLHLDTIATDLPEKYLTRALKFGLGDTVLSGSLGEVGLFLLSAWIAGPLELGAIVNAGKLRVKIIRESRIASTGDLAAIAGATHLFALPVTFAHKSQGSLASIARLLRRFNILIEATPENQDVRVRAYRLALAIVGISHLYPAEAKGLLSEHLDKTALLKVLNEVLAESESANRTMMAEALRRAFLNTSRKEKLLREACEALA
jgi:hypothetical protein